MIFGRGPSGDTWPLWHCSLSLRRDPLPPLPLNEWTDEDFEAARKAAETVLRGAGDSTRRHEQRGTVALHIRRPCSTHEGLTVPVRKRLLAARHW